MQALLHQVGDNNDFMPINQTRDEGNDDQGFWALSAMNAAEQNFPDPPADQPQWTALVQAVFNEYVSRWDDQNCGGGLPWQITSLIIQNNYKNSVANGCFFNIAARLQRYTGNSSYGDWAAKIWDWEESVGLITEEYEVFDGVTIEPNHTCPSIDRTEWTYNAGLFLHGAATMYNMTGSDEWKQRVDGILNHTATKFFQNGVMWEQFCEPRQDCDLDQQSFKGYFARFLSATSLLAPHTSTQIMGLLNSSAPAAASVCVGSGATFRGVQGQACGFSWLEKGSFDGMTGIGEQLNALSSVMYTLTPSSKTPVTLHTGGTSQSNPDAGNTANPIQPPRPITTAERVGAGFATVFILAGFTTFCAILIL